MAQKFKSHYSLHNVKVNGASVHVDVKAAEDMLETLYKLIVEETCLSKFGKSSLTEKIREISQSNGLSLIASVCSRLYHLGLCMYTVMLKL